nr:unnamed protein product [Digitaria exilis]
MPTYCTAEIGLSMGIQGTVVEKESSDIIILDGNIASVVWVVRWARSVYSNNKKFIQFHLTVNAATLIINLVAAASSGNVMPLNAVQVLVTLLWTNLITAALGAFALAIEPPTEHLMQRPPVSRRSVLDLIFHVP